MWLHRIQTRVVSFEGPITQPLRHLATEPVSIHALIYHGGGGRAGGLAGGRAGGGGGRRLSVCACVLVCDSVCIWSCACACVCLWLSTDDHWKPHTKPVSCSDRPQLFTVPVLFASTRYLSAFVTSEIGLNLALLYRSFTHTVVDGHTCVTDGKRVSECSCNA